MYILKLREELVWALIIALATYSFQVMADFSPEAVTDWRAWGIAIAAGAVRSIGAALLVIIGRAKLQSPTP